MIKSIELTLQKRKDIKMCAKRDRKPGFDSEFDGVTLKIKLRGEIDHHAAAVVRVNIDELIRSRTPKTLLLDMSAVDFMDSSGLGLIMGRYSLMQTAGGEMYVLDPSPAAEKIMRLAGMERMIKIKRTAASSSKEKEPRRREGIEMKRRSERHRTAGSASSSAKLGGVQSVRKENDKGDVK